MSKMSRKKKKLSVDFDNRTYNRMLQYTHHQGMSNGGFINFCVTNLLALDQDSKRMFSKAILNYIDQLDLKISVAGEVEQYFAIKQKETVMNLLDFFTDGTETVKESVIKTNHTMKQIEIKDGYVLVPKSWIVLKNQNPLDCSYVGVVEIANAIGFDKPYFVFFLKNPIYEMKEEDLEVINQECISEYPKFKEILKQQIEPKNESNFDSTPEEFRCKGSRIGYYPISESDIDPSFPFGVKIVRNKK